MAAEGRGRCRLGPAAILALLFACSGIAAAQDGGESRLTGLKLSGDQPIEIESDRLEIRDNDRVAVFSGNVRVVQGATVMRSGRMIVHYSNDGGSISSGGAGIEKLEVDGTVHLRSQDQVATGDRASFNMRDEVLVLTGERVVLSEGDNVIVGCRLTVEMRSGQARFEGCASGESSSGRIIMQITPGARSN